MSNSLVDVATGWIGTGAGRPTFAMPFAAPPPRVNRFGDPDGAAVHDALTVRPAAGAELRAPTNALAWQVPTTDVDPAVLPAWPRLKRLDGSLFGPRRSPAVLQELDVLLEVWPAAFRRLEYIVSTLDIPVGVTDWDLPQMPVPRWFWLRGTGGLGQHANDIALKQFADTGIDPDQLPFFEGLVPLYVAAGDVLWVADDGTKELQIRAFDSQGLVVDPDWIFQIFELLGSDSDFGQLKFPWPGSTAPWNAPERHVLVFSDSGGAPYASRNDPDDVLAPPPPEREVTFPDTAASSQPIPMNGLVVVNSPDPAFEELANEDKLVQLELPGAHQRLSLRPHGTLGKRTRASFGQHHSFFRVQVTDLAQWFPTSANLRNATAGDDQFERYTDHNEILPLIDGQDMLRAMYRALRATHVHETYSSPDHIPAQDPDAVVAPASAEARARARIYLTNAWIDANVAFLGRRAYIAAPRTQGGVAPDLEALRDGFVLVGALAPSGMEDPAVGSGALADYRLWWLVPTTPLPPGAYLDLRQLAYIDKVRGDDPRLPGVELNASIYGILGPLGDHAPTSSAFVGTTGRAVLSALFKPGEAAQADLRVVTFSPDEDDPAPTSTATSGKGTKHIYSSGEIQLPEPVDPLTPPPFVHPAVVTEPSLRIEFDGTPGRAVVVIAAGTLTDLVPVVVMNARSGEIYGGVLGPNPGSELRVPVEPFALRDWLLVGFSKTAELDPAKCEVFFTLRVTPDQVLAGGALGHPTESLGALQEALLAGVETRLLVWHATDAPSADRLYSATGMVGALKAGVNGQCGQAIRDSLNRREFGVHHQKTAFLRTAQSAAEGGGVLAFVGGIDLMTNRWDTPQHLGIEPDRQSGPFHDVHCRVRGRAAWDVLRNFRQRWNAAFARPDLVGSVDGLSTVKPISDVTVYGANAEFDPAVTLRDGDCVAQINRTLAPHVSAHHEFLDTERGDQSIWKAYRRAIREARRFVYIEDQYFWETEIAMDLHQALVAGRLDFVVLVLPKQFHDAGLGDLLLYALRRRAVCRLLFGVPEVPTGTPAVDMSSRVAILTIKNDFDEPVYVHCKVAVADDLWLAIGSSNMTRRSMTYDGELGVMSIDRRTRRGGQKTVREFRVELMADHLGLVPEERPLLDDPDDAFRLIKDFIEGRWVGRNTRVERSGIAEMDLLHTHFGRQPSDLDGTFVDAVQALADPDGNKPELPFGLLDLRQLMDALTSATDGQTFGGIGSLHVSFNVAALGNPADIVVAMSALEAGRPESARIDLGTFLATTTVNAGVVHTGVTYRLRGIAAFVAAPTMPIGGPVFLDVTPSGTSTTALVAFA